MNAPRRRALLGVAGLAAVGRTGGCLRRLAPGSDASPGTASTSTTRESTDATETESTATGPVRTDDLFLANERSDDRLLDVRVTRTRESDSEADAEPLLHRRYEVPADSRVELRNLGTVGNSYAVEARFPGGAWRQYAWAVTDCTAYGTPTREPRTPEDDPALNTDAMIRIADDGLEFLRNSCDGIAFSEGEAIPADECVVRDFLATTTA